MKKCVSIILACFALLNMVHAETASSNAPNTPNQTNGTKNPKASVPSINLVASWWNKSSSEKIDIGNIKQIGLLSGEEAYLAEAAFGDRGRNDMFGAVLIRPMLQEVREVSRWIKIDTSLLPVK